MVQEERVDSRTFTEVKEALAVRRQAAELFGKSVVQSAAWEILLELFSAELAEQLTQTTHLIEEANASRATRLRLLDTLERDGRICRFMTSKDKRSRFVKLTPRGVLEMRAYFARIKTNDAQPLDDACRLPSASAFAWDGIGSVAD